MQSVLHSLRRVSECGRREFSGGIFICSLLFCFCFFTKKPPKGLGPGESDRAGRTVADKAGGRKLLSVASFHTEEHGL